MKKLLLSITLGISSLATMAQMGTATDFTITDIEGNTHHLYDILDQGYVVVLDASATWCGTCWSVHQNHTLNDLNTQKGPNGTNEVRVIFYEADAGTTLDDLNGTGSNTLGDWVTGTNYPIVSESAPLSLSGSVYWPLGFPTISVIRPADREITADVWNQSVAGMVAAVDNAIATNPASIGSDFVTDNGITSYPNPTVDVLNVNLGSVANQVDGLSVRNIMGQEVMNISTSGQTLVRLSMETLTSGAYILEYSYKGSVLGVQKIMKD